jgi:NAD(P)-dependent dehydrogenase (short-subunit alcohol dehydrogenase family)
MINNPEVDQLIVTQRHMHAEQQKQDAKRESESKSSEKESAIQAGPNDQPDNPLPPLQLDKPGLEKDMTLKPRYQAPHYRGSGKLEGMVALITGGDSGIGRAVAVLYAREGANVALVYLSEHEDAEKTAQDIKAEGRQCLLLPGDVRQSGFCQQAVEEVIKKWGRLDILVNNAAFQLHADNITDLSDERIDMTLDTNVKGYFYMARAAVPHLQEGASIINTGSVVGLRGSESLLDYATTKGAIHAFTKSLASNLIDKGIRVNAVAPGPVWTPFNPADKPIEDIKKFGADTDMKRVAQPEEIAPAYVFLASPCCASYISGIVLPITGTVGAI